jgi:KaiC domain protein
VIAVSERTDDEDWFERALEDDPGSDPGSDDAESDGSELDSTADTDDGSPGDGPDEADRSDVTSDDGGVDSGSTAKDAAGELDADPDAAGEFGMGEEFEGDDATDQRSTGDEDGDADLFEQDFASALSNAPEGLGDEGGEIDMSDELDVGGGDFDMGGGAGGGEFGGGGDEFGGLGGSESFDDEELDTDIDRIDLGIEGLDDMVQGGVPERSLMVAIGSAGTGKTTFGLQFLDEELRQEDGGNAVFITLEESRERIINSATEKGYPFDEYAEAGQLAIVDLDPIDMANSLATIRSELPRLIGEFDARRLVLDSVSLLEMMYDSRATRRNEIYDFTKSLKQSGVTTMLTSEASSDSAYTSRYGIVEYLTDAVFVLQYVRPSDFRKTRLAIEIQKIRDANHSRETKPYEITNEGISVYQQANIF